MESRSPLVRGCQPGKRKTCITVVVLAVLIGTVLVAYKAFGSKANDPSLKKVFIVFRHGDRNPTETYPNDPHLHYPWPDGWGALTKKGMKQMYGLGGYLREEYGWLTNNKYSSANVLVNSSYSDRCIMSTQALLAGLYPPDEKDAFVSELLWRPIPVHYMPKTLDQILVVGKSCPRLKQALEESYRNESLRSDAQLKSYYEELTKLTGQTMKTITDVEFLYNTLEIEVMNGLPLPDWMKGYYNETMRELAAKSYSLFTSNTLQRRLRGGPLLKHILDNMKHGKDTEKVFLYGTHDINIVNTLRAMGLIEDYKLELGVTLIFELHSTNGGQTREVWISKLDSADSRSPKKLKIPNCKNDDCELDELFRVWKDVLPENWDEECQF